MNNKWENSLWNLCGSLRFFHPSVYALLCDSVDPQTTLGCIGERRFKGYLNKFLLGKEILALVGMYGPASTDRSSSVFLSFFWYIFYFVSNLCFLCPISNFPQVTYTYNQCHGPEVFFVWETLAETEENVAVILDFTLSQVSRMSLFLLFYLDCTFLLSLI